MTIRTVDDLFEDWFLDVSSVSSVRIFPNEFASKIGQFTDFPPWFDAFSDHAHQLCSW